jgi:hypothetical protein
VIIYSLINLKKRILKASYQEWWRDWPDETRQPAFIYAWCQILQEKPER